MKPCSCVGRELNHDKVPFSWASCTAYLRFLGSWAIWMLVEDFITHNCSYWIDFLMVSWQVSVSAENRWVWCKSREDIGAGSLTELLYSLLRYVGGTMLRPLSLAERANNFISVSFGGVCLVTVGMNLVLTRSSSGCSRWQMLGVVLQINYQGITIPWEKAAYAACREEGATSVRFSKIDFHYSTLKLMWDSM